MPLEDLAQLFSMPTRLQILVQQELRQVVENSLSGSSVGIGSDDGFGAQVAANDE